MPRLKIATNVPQASIPANFLADAATMFQEAIGKPMEVDVLSTITHGTLYNSHTHTHTHHYHHHRHSISVFISYQTSR